MVAAGGVSAVVIYALFGLSVLGLLAVTGFQAVSGLFANDDIAYQGHLYPLVGADLSARITGIHKLFEPLLILLVALHVGAIAFYVKVKKTNLTIPMITGVTEVENPPAAAPRGGGAVAFVIALIIAVAAAYAASGALLPEPAPATAVETPAF